jgi:hypothetical protein
MTTVMYVAPGVDLGRLCGFVWECRWTLCDVHAELINGDCVVFRICLN